MNTVLSVAAGLVWGAAVALIAAQITKKMVKGGEKEISALSLVRTIIDAAALAVVYFTRNLVPLRFEVTLIATAVSLTLIGIVTAYRTASKMK